MKPVSLTDGARVGSDAGAVASRLGVFSSLLFSLETRFPRSSSVTGPLQSLYVFVEIGFDEAHLLGCVRAQFAPQRALQAEAASSVQLTVLDWEFGRSVFESG